MQVWWYCTGALKGQLQVHNLATGESLDVSAAASGPAIKCMELDSRGNIWMGYKDGSVRVWNEGRHAPLCKPLKCFQAEAR